MIWLLFLAADVTGFWTGQIQTRLGPQDVTFKLEQQGTKLTGKLYDDRGSSPLSEGRVVGDAVIFVVAVQEQSGNQINDTRLRYTGTLRDGVLELARDRESSTIAGNSGGVFQRSSTKQLLKLKRLY
ncbi:MAG: hypothetical protein K2X03_19285 [Bryobacteraceae bacterium]|nr:hypothetical protein [Bryobacteraceae bacterium]